MIKINYRALFADKIKVIEFNGESLLIDFYKFIQLEYPSLIRPYLALRWFDADSKTEDDTVVAYLLSVVSTEKMKTTTLAGTLSYVCRDLDYQVVVGLEFQCLCKEPTRLYMDSKTTFEELSTVYLTIWSKQNGIAVNEDRKLLLFTSEDRKTEIQDNEQINFKTSSFLIFWLANLRTSVVYVKVESPSSSHGGPVVPAVVQEEEEEIEEIPTKKKKRKRKGDLIVRIRQLTGKAILLDCNQSNTIQELKQMINAKLGIPIDQQRLIYAGRQLEENNTMADYNLANDAVIHLILRLTGC